MTMERVRNFSTGYEQGFVSSPPQVLETLSAACFDKGTTEKTKTRKTRIMSRTKLTMQDYVDAFDRLATFRCVYVIQEEFNGNASDFFESPAKLKQFSTLTQPQKNATYASVFRNIRHFNFAGISNKDLSSILGHNYRSADFMAEFREQIKALGYTIQPHGTLVYGGERHSYPAKYLPSKLTIFEIFNDEKKVNDILDFRNYAKKEQRVLYRWSTENKTEEQKMEHPSDKALCRKYNWTQEQLDNLRANGLLDYTVSQIERKKRKGQKTERQTLLDQVANLTAAFSQLQQQIAAGTTPQPASTPTPPVQLTAKAASKVIRPSGAERGTAPIQPFGNPNEVVDAFKDMLLRGVGNPWAFRHWIVPIITDYLFQDVEAFWANLPSSFRERFTANEWFSDSTPEEQMRICTERGRLLRRLYTQMSGPLAGRMFKDEKINGKFVPASERRINGAKNEVKKAFDHARLAFLEAKNDKQQAKEPEAPQRVVEIREVKVTVNPVPKKIEEPSVDDLDALLDGVPVEVPEAKAEKYSSNEELEKLLKFGDVERESTPVQNTCKDITF